MSGIKAEPIPILSDNYAWLLQEPASGATAVADPADPGPVIQAVERAGGRLDLILLTHHHADHVAGTDEVRRRFGAKVVGAAADAHRLPKLDQAVREGDVVVLGKASGRVIDTPGHTRGHIAYLFQGEPNAPPGVLICGDTLFSLGCGRLLEGTPEELFASLQKFSLLTGDTLVCCGHEYTESNARFALSVEPDNQALQQRAAEVQKLRAAGRPTVPSTIGEELAANPFMRATSAASLGALRAKKDAFR
jgi:hydroxyacylglutathione hydrolase